MSRFKAYTVNDYIKYLKDMNVTRTIKDIHLHHTYKPTKKDYENAEDKERIIWGMWRYHTEEKGYNDIAQHVSISPDGLIWTGRDINVIPASIKGHNEHAFCIEMIGNFDYSVEKLNGKQYKTVIELIVALFDIFNTNRLTFHREHSNKTCPGSSISKADILEAVNNYQADWRIDLGKLALESLVKKGYINTPSKWEDKMLESAPLWLVLHLFNKFSKNDV